MSRALAGLGALGVALGVALGTSSGCASQLGDGSWGTFRYIGRVKGTAPLNVLPPISDRAGNVYTLYGAIGVTEVAAFVSRASGGSLETCATTKGDVYGAHGWVGFADDRAWYWAGDSLVVVPSAAACAAILDKDPSTNVDLRFRGVIPWVRVLTSRTSLVAIVQSPTDPAPFSALVDLDVGIMTNVSRLDVGENQTIAVLGVGADPGNGGVVLVAVNDAGGGGRMKALFYDQDAHLVATAPVDGAPPPDYGVSGYMHYTSSGTVVGLTTLGSLVVLTRAGGATQAIDPSIQPIGVHAWGGALWLVGTANGKPVVAPIDASGRVGAPSEWTASERAAQALGGTLPITDDRSFPARSTSWANVTSAMGTSPFLTAHSPWPHAPQTTLWAVAGPSYATNGLSMTAIAVAPVGIAYP